MKGLKVNTLPTGYLFSNDYKRGRLETLSIGDYGKSQNVKADFLGLTREINGVPNQECMPLSEKWVITLSTQYGCPQKCRFCDVPKLGYKGNATFDDLKDQLVKSIEMFPTVHYVERLNIHFARMGEPIFNKAVFEFSEWLFVEGKKFLRDEYNLIVETLHPVLTSSLPSKMKPELLKSRIEEWVNIKNNVYNGQAGLQLSINSTCNEQRNEMFDGCSISLEELSEMVTDLPKPVGRKYCLNFAYAQGYEVDGEKLAKLFDTDKFMCKITPIHNNVSCSENGIETVDGYDSYHPYRGPEESLKAAGFDVLVFVPSLDEEDGLVTCGNLELSGTEVRVSKDSEIKIKGL